MPTLERGMKTQLADLPPDFSLYQLRQHLWDFPEAVDREQIQKNLLFIHSLGQPAVITRLLQTILDDPALTAKIAGRSYRHVNHFDKILLIDSEFLGYRLTLHLWDPPYSQEQLDDELIHEHRFSFWSTILTGTLASQNFDHVDDDAEVGVTYRKYQYTPENTSKANFYSFKGEAKLAVRDIARATEGSSYYLSFDSIHRVLLPKDGMTCTLVLRGPRERTFSNVFNTSYPSEDVQIDNPMFSPNELRAKIHLILETVSQRAD